MKWDRKVKDEEKLGQIGEIDLLHFSNPFHLQVISQMFYRLLTMKSPQFLSWNADECCVCGGTCL